MSVGSTVNRNNYTGNGSVNIYDYTFRITSENDLEVKVLSTTNVEYTLTKTTDYTVSGVGISGGGSITLVNASQAWLTSGNLTTGWKISIRRVVSLTQQTDIRNQGAYFPEIHEDEFDKSRFIDQQQQDEIDRSFKLPATFDPATFDTELPADIATAGAFLQVNGTGNGMVAVNALTDSEVALPAGTGIMVRTGTTSAQLRTITGTANEIDISDGDGVSGNPTIGISDNPVISGNEKIRIPVGTTAQRPSSPSSGDIRYNTSTGKFEIYIGSSWVNYALEAAGAPAGSVMAYAGTSAPTGYLICDGSAISRTTYADLYAVVGVTHGEGDGSTTFNIPDYRGRFIRGFDNSAGNDPDAGTRTAMNTGGNTGDNVGTLQADQTRAIDTLQIQSPAGTAPVTIPHDGTYSSYFGSTSASNTGTGSISFRAKTNSGEVRPVNASVNFIIKY